MGGLRGWWFVVGGLWSGHQRSTTNHQPFFVHPSAYVDDGAEMGAGTKIWHFCHVMKGARIGRNCVLGQNVNVDAGVVVGDRVYLTAAEDSDKGLKEFAVCLNTKDGSQQWKVALPPSGT